MSFRSNVVTAALAVAAGMLSVSGLEAQQPVQPDTAGANRLPAIVSTAEREGLLRRVWNMQERRHEVIELERDNRRLAHELKEYDRKIVRLETKLDSLKAREAEMLRLIEALDSATAATRASRLALEARLRAIEDLVAKGGGGR